MNASIILISLASVLSFATIFLLVVSGRPVALPAEITSASCALLCFAAAFVQLLGALRADSRARKKNSADEGSSAPTVKCTIQAMLAGIKKIMSDSDETVRATLEYPLIDNLFKSVTEREFAERLAAAHIRCDRAENVLSTLSDRVITDSLIYLPLANAIIKAVPAKTEEAAMTVLEKFMVVRDASAKAAESARTLRERLEASGSEESVTFAADLSRSAVRKERDVIRELSKTTKDSRSRLQQMSEEISAGLELLKNISEITERSKLIAFNMSIEAARIGEKGRGFKVIITELHKLNDRTFDFSRQVADLLHAFREHTAGLVGTMEEKSVAVVREVESGMDAAETAVEKLIEASSRTEQFTREIAGMSERIDHDLDGVLESMQFQDITRQMIEGSIAIIDDLQKTLDDCLSRNEIVIDEGVKQTRFSTIKNRLIENAKTKGEKEALMEVHV